MGARATIQCFPNYPLATKLAKIATKQLFSPFPHSRINFLELKISKMIHCVFIGFLLLFRANLSEAQLCLQLYLRVHQKLAATIRRNKCSLGLFVPQVSCMKKIVDHFLGQSMDLGDFSFDIFR